jgi:hypothetical protein
MAIHVADPEVTRLLNTYVGYTGLTKTEALRRLLQAAVEEEEEEEGWKRRKKNLRAVALEIMAEAKQAGLKAPTKEQIDALYEGTAE